jgi:hypothetical protein
MLRKASGNEEDTIPSKRRKVEASVFRCVIPEQPWHEDSVSTDEEFVEPFSPPPPQVHFKSRAAKGENMGLSRYSKPTATQDQARNHLDYQAFVDLKNGLEKQIQNINSVTCAHTEETEAEEKKSDFNQIMPNITNHTDDIATQMFSWFFRVFFYLLSLMARGVIWSVYGIVLVVSVAIMVPSWIADNTSRGIVGAFSNTPIQENVCHTLVMTACRDIMKNVHHKCSNYARVCTYSL